MLVFEISYSIGRGFSLKAISSDEGKKSLMTLTLPIGSLEYFIFFMRGTFEILGKRFLQSIGVNLGKFGPVKFFGNSFKDKLAGIEHFDTY